jgi:ComF family protein
MATDHSLCLRCQQHSLPFTEVIIPLRYTYPVDQWIGFYKYQSMPGMAHWLSLLLLAHLEQRLQRRPTLITGVPMHPQKQRERGYNQSLLLARQLARALDLPFEARLLQKPKVTSHQRTLNAASRRLNLQGAFNVREHRGWGRAKPLPIEGQHIAVVDDVVTTGATSAEIAQCLLGAGAASVSLWALAKTPLHTPQA